MKEQYYEAWDRAVRESIAAHAFGEQAEQCSQVRVTRGKVSSHYFLQYRMYAISIDVNRNEILFSSTASYSPTKRSVLFYKKDGAVDSGVTTALANAMEAMWGKLSATTHMSGLTGFAFPFEPYQNREAEA